MKTKSEVVNKKSEVLSYCLSLLPIAYNLSPIAYSAIGASYSLKEASYRHSVPSPKQKSQFSCRNAIFFVPLQAKITIIVYIYVKNTLFYILS